ncbi:MAG: phosphate ABC transporter permease subunit PstC [Proteobacteria bacterium]|nr:phosphate ABC transporter permease subunit PstC [Pseudomonadota bacterium]
MIWLAVPLLVLFSAAAFALGRRRALAVTAGVSVPFHSRPGHYGLYVALWTVGPALALLAAIALAAPTLEASTPGAGALARNLALVLAGAAALIGLFAGLGRIAPGLRARASVERVFRILLLISSATAVLTMAGIALSLAAESLRFFAVVSPARFFAGSVWDPEIGAFGAGRLFARTALVAVTALLTCAPAGILAAIYLAEYATPRVRSVLKPGLEMLAGAPGVVWGLFAALTLAPLLHDAIAALHLRLGPGTQLSMIAGIAIGMMLLPFVAALSDDVLRATPSSLRWGSYAAGATKSETVLRVVLPTAWPGIGAALLLALGRALGETMIVVMVAGLIARADAAPGISAVTAEIANLLHWDQDFARPTTLAAYGLGLTLFLATLGINFAAQKIVRAYGERHV